MGSRHLGPETGYSRIIPSGIGWYECAYEESIDEGYPALCLYMNGKGGIFSLGPTRALEPVHGDFIGAWWKRWKGEPVLNLEMMKGRYGLAPQRNQQDFNGKSTQVGADDGQT